MVQSSTAEEMKLKNIELMGKELGEIYSQLWQEVTWLHFKWDEYLEVYGSNPSKIDLINQTAPQFFYIIEKSLWETILLHITRLTDPANPMNKKDKRNLTIRQFENQVVDEKLEIELLDTISVAVTNTQFCRDWRNRHIAHSDLDLSLNRSSKPLASASRKLVIEAIKSIDSVLNTVSYFYDRSTTEFDIGDSFNGAGNLLYYLNYGLKMHNEKEKRIESGNYTDEDLEIEEI